MKTNNSVQGDARFGLMMVMFSAALWGTIGVFVQILVALLASWLLRERLTLRILWAGLCSIDCNSISMVAPR